MSNAEARTFYDAFGSKQDKQFYERRPVEELVRRGDFERAKHVVEFGCGTGGLASRLLRDVLPADSRYVCLDISQTMVSLCAEKTKGCGDRVRCVRTDGATELPVADGSADRVVSAYVLDLLSEADARQLVAEACRVLSPEGYLCLAGLTNGVSVVSRAVEFLWKAAYRASPRIVGGCRPVKLSSYLEEDVWEIVHHETIVSYGVPSEVLVASPRRGES